MYSLLFSRFHVTHNSTILFAFPLDRWDPPAAAHHEREGDHGGVRLPLHRQALQDLQGQEVPLHAHGVLPRRVALDHPQVKRKCSQDNYSFIIREKKSLEEGFVFRPFLVAIQFACGSSGNWKWRKRMRLELLVCFLPHAPLADVWLVGQRQLNHKYDTNSFFSY